MMHSILILPVSVEFTMTKIIVTSVTIKKVIMNNFRIIARGVLANVATFFLYCQGYVLD